MKKISLTFPLPLFVVSPIHKEFDVFKPEEHREGWKCPKSFGYFPDQLHCDKFYHCSLGTPSLKECSDGLSYNLKHQTCDWKAHVRCKCNYFHIS